VAVGRIWPVERETAFESEGQEPIEEDSMRRLRLPLVPLKTRVEISAEDDVGATTVKCCGEVVEDVVQRCDRVALDDRACRLITVTDEPSSRRASAAATQPG
jgi:hypothetical protein